MVAIVGVTVVIVEVVAVAVVVHWCLSKTSSKISFSSWAESTVFGPQHGSGQTPTSSSQGSTTTQRLYHLLLIMEFQSYSHMSFICQKQLGPCQTVGWDPLAHTGVSQGFLPKKHPGVVRKSANLWELTKRVDLHSFANVSGININLKLKHTNIKLGTVLEKCWFGCLFWTQLYRKMDLWYIRQSHWYQCRYT